jgi:hypothetical protein
MANTKPQVTVNALESKSITNRIKWFGTPEIYKQKQKTNQDMKTIMEGISAAIVCGGRAGTNFTMHKLDRLYKQM